MIVFDITEHSTFANVNQWISAVNDKCQNQPPVILVGNKSDLQDEREVTLQDIQFVSEANQLFYIETSAKTGQNVR